MHAVTHNIILRWSCVMLAVTHNIMLRWSCVMHAVTHNIMLRWCCVMHAVTHHIILRWCCVTNEAWAGVPSHSEHTADEYPHHMGCLYNIICDAYTTLYGTPIPHYMGCLYDIIYLLTWILRVASKQLRLLHGRVVDSTIVVNSLSPQMSELVEDAFAS